MGTKPFDISIPEEMILALRSGTVAIGDEITFDGTHELPADPSLRDYGLIRDGHRGEYYLTVLGRHVYHAGDMANLHFEIDPQRIVQAQPDSTKSDGDTVEDIEHMANTVSAIFEKWRPGQTKTVVPGICGAVDVYSYAFHENELIDLGNACAANKWTYVLGMEYRNPGNLEPEIRISLFFGR